MTTMHPPGTPVDVMDKMLFEAAGMPTEDSESSEASAAAKKASM